ncbi:AT-hook motif nuclear-localized protein 5 [Sesamum alatum]|uniref:AT-hook motif nuclear-localized protein n=1 Tax=Sesamum alatum TaxID=300844 RepID=A0AAE1Y333_9LAMI|nr:AT-hook motif nuclear-localized protein 5 [Sesamum alatum]
MDGREGMTLQGSASYYLNRAGFGGSGPGPNVHGAGGGSATAQAGGINTPPVFKTHSNPNIQVHQNVGMSGGSVSGSAFHVENPSSNFAHGMSDRMNMSIVSSSPRGGETVKKKRGRPRKYGPDGANMSLGLSPMSASTPSSGTVTPGEKPRRGRPPGTGWKQKLAPLGDWMNSSAGLAFTPHVLHIGAGEDVAAKVLAFAQQRPRALCILSGSGSVSAVTLRQPTTSGGTVTYEGRFEILCLSGSYLLAESGGPRNRTGGISISVCSPDGHMIGGAIGGKLIAANLVQVVACSFVYGGTKAKNKAESGSTDEKYLIEQQSAGNSSTPLSAAPTQNLTPNSGTSIWPLGSRLDAKSSQGGIDLMRG